MEGLGVEITASNENASFLLVHFRSCTVHLDTFKIFYLPTDAQ